MTIRRTSSLSLLVFCCMAWNGAIALPGELAALTGSFEMDEIRVLYTTKGTDAVNKTDLDGNKVPDQIEDIARQAWAARRVFCDVLEYPDPLKSERYKEVTSIEISIRHKDAFGGGNGIAWERAEPSARKKKKGQREQVLKCTVGSHVMAHRNATPAYSMFNLTQYGVTYFKNSWYLQGMARWSEQGLRRGGIGSVSRRPKDWPTGAAGRTLVFAMRSDAEAQFWNPIVMSVDTNGRMPAARIDTQLRALRYSDGTSVLADFSLNGAAFMRDVLLELGRVDDIAFKQLGYNEWSEDNQRSLSNNLWIYQAVQDVTERHIAASKQARNVPAQTPLSNPVTANTGR